MRRTLQTQEVLMVLGFSFFYQGAYLWGDTQAAYVFYGFLVLYLFCLYQVIGEKV